MTKENPHIRSVSELDELLAIGDVPAFVAKCERHHAERLARIAELIATRIPAVRLVLEAGPSAAGKTTSAIRLCRALEANGLTALRISTDDTGKERLSYINRMTLRRFKKICARLGIKPYYYREIPLRKVFTPLAKLPGIREMFVKMAVVVLNKQALNE